MAAIYFRETKKRYYINLPGFFDPSELDKFDADGRIIDHSYFDIKTNTRIFEWRFHASAAVLELLKTTPAKDITKGMLDAAINESLREGGVI